MGCVIKLVFVHWAVALVLTKSYIDEHSLQQHIHGLLTETTSSIRSFFYRPQQSCGQGNIFAPVCHSVHGGCLPQCMLGYHPPRSRHPLGSRHPPSRHPPLEAHPRGADPPRADTPQEQTPPPGKQTPAYGQ